MPLALQQVNYTYMPATPFAVHALNNIDFEARDGEFIGIIGTTGCGKSTMIQTMAGLIKPDSGSVLLDGLDIQASGFDRRVLRKTVGVVFQYPEYQLFEETVGEDVAFGPRKAGMSPEEVSRNVDAALRIVGFSPKDIQSASPFELSGGQKRRVAIAGVLATNPRILILDEPIAGLDPVSRQQFMDLARRLNENGVTIIMISHNMDDLAAYASRIVAMNKGEIILDGPPKKVFADVESLRAIGLASSEARQAGYLLTQRGFPVPSDIITNSELASYVAQVLKGEREC